MRVYVKEANSDSHFFDDDAMRHFGDSMRNYGVRKVNAFVYNCKEIELRETPAYELYRRHTVKHGNQKSAYFCRKTYK